jgi:hypothetical protein
MGFDKIRQGREEIFILVVESPEIINGKKERERWTVMKKDFPKLIDMIATKYGLDIGRRKQENKDLEWLGIKG